ncbi:hypothetical protein ABT126_39145 [Streptomyces sp. NPDC002012]|uniref:hypothetical protein n=1 Tax=Streptomyces sp. NPDC002012 TaxID=3154532 RepID=UPI00331FD3AD
MARTYPSPHAAAYLNSRASEQSSACRSTLVASKEVVLCVSPNGRSYVVDRHRTSLLAGLTTAKVIAQDGRESRCRDAPTRTFVDAAWARWGR